MNTNVTPIHQQLGLSRHPFPPAPDADGYFYTPDIEHRLAEAVHCLMTRKGFVLLTGEVGMGKSTFVRRMLTLLQTEHHASVSLVLNTFVQGQELLSAILRDFGLYPGANAQESIECLNNYLIDSHRRNITCILVIDDAQNLTLESLELVRLLTNLETGQEKLLQIMLCGQPELLDTLQQPAIRQLASRIVEHLQLLALTVDELGRYIEFRLALAGAGGRIRISGSALSLLHDHSAGNPRRVHLILDRCLYGLVPDSGQIIDNTLVEQAARQAGIQQRHATATQTRWRRWAVPGVASAIMLAVVPYLYQKRTVLGEWIAGTAAQAPAAAAEQENVPAPRPAPTATAPQPVPGQVSSEAPVSDSRSLAGAPERPATGPSALQRLCPRLALLPDKAPERIAQLIWDLPTGVEARLRLRDDVCLLPDPGFARALWMGDMTPENFLHSYAHDDVRHAQAKLHALGYYPDRPDGLYGARTRQAMQAFQAHQGLAETGYPDTLTLMLLAGATPLTGAYEIDDGLSSILSNIHNHD
ncbi:MAG: AAA family ATPase [Candidimonas sp.]